MIARKIFPVCRPDGRRGHGSMYRIGIIGAMDEELQTLKNAAVDLRTVRRAGMEFNEGLLGKTEVVIVKSGMGKVNAGICTQILIGDFHVTAVINTGVAGSLDKALGIGDLVISTDVVQHDFDVSPIGYRRGEIPDSGMVAFPADGELRVLAAAAVRKTAPEVKAVEGRVCSGDQFISSDAQKEAITSLFGGKCCEMEGGAIAQVCFLNRVPFVVIRAISDSADEESGVSFEAFLETAARRCAAVVLEMTASLKTA